MLTAVPSKPGMGQQPQVDLDALVSAAGDAIIVADPEGVIRFWNPELG